MQGVTASRSLLAINDNNYEYRRTLYLAIWER